MSARCLKTSGLGPLLFASGEPLLSNLHDMNYTLQDSSKAAVLVENQAVLQIHADTPNISAPPTPPCSSASSRVGFLALLQVRVPGRRPWRFPPPPRFFVSVSFSIKNKYIYLIIGSSSDKKQSSVILLGGARVLDGEKLQVKYFLLSPLLFICKSACPPIYLLLRVFRQGPQTVPAVDRMPAIPRQRGT